MSEEDFVKIFVPTSKRKGKKGPIVEKIVFEGGEEKILKKLHKIRKVLQ